MTSITLHGLLGKKFGRSFKIKINNALSALKAIDANRPGFMNEILSLSKKEEDYCIIINGTTVCNSNELYENKILRTVDLVPVIAGSGEIAAAFFISAFSLAGTAASIAGFVITTLVNIAISLGIQYIMSKLLKEAEPPTNPQKYQAVGGASSVVQAAGKSYVFNNMLNIAEQGSAIPVGYGRAKIASRVIFSTVKNYSTSSTFQEEALRINQQIAFYNDFLTA
jgi:predicted phage tail protein